MAHPQALAPRRADGPALTPLYVDLRPGESAAVEILRACAAAAAVGAAADWAGLSGHRDEVVATMLDLAEDAHLLCVVDNLHHTGATAARWLLERLARYGRGSRFLFASREPVAIPELHGQVVALGPMPEAELAELARAWMPSRVDDLRARAVRGAAGSPWLLSQLLLEVAAQARATDGPRPSAATTGLDDEERAFLAVLAVLARPFPVEVLATFAVVPAASALVALERRGLLELGADGVRLHDAAREALRDEGPRRDGRPEPETREARRRASRALRAQPGHDAALEVLRLELSLDDGAAARALLDARGEALLAAGYAEELWGLLAARDDVVLERWRLRTALHLGPRAQASIEPPRAREPADRLL